MRKGWKVLECVAKSNLARYTYMPTIKVSGLTQPKKLAWSVSVRRYGKPFEKILVRRSAHVGILVASIGVIPSLEAILTFPPTLAPDRDLCEKGKLHTIQMSSF